MSLPNYDEQPSSPSLHTVGIAAKLGSEVFARGQPVVLSGSYLIDAPMIQRMKDEALEWIQVVVVRRDRPGVWSRAARQNPRVALARPDSIPVSPTARAGGWFNLDLRQHLDLPDEPGRYWVFVVMGDHMTERMAFELK